MARFMLLYAGPPTPPDASQEGWPAWFAKLGDKLADRGSPLTEGISRPPDGSTSSSATRLNGYSIIHAEDADEALRLLTGHPYLAQAGDYSIDVYRLP